ncbi:major facilitator superfamily domain-containing protein [Melanogaster broomeanus]|nr:major facilitator superfamily domain-containing protein [Melanogaster broomeanus]
MSATHDRSFDGERDNEKNGNPDVYVKQDLFTDSSLDPVYQAKARILNDAMQEIGMGKYQWLLFIVAGFGWLSDNLWPIVTGLILDPVVNEFKLAQNIGLLVGAAFWGVASDVWGRRWSFNLTLLITGVFALAAGASPNYVTLCSLAAVWSIGVGGNLPVDSAVFLEFTPASHQYLLTVLSIWWAFGQLLGSLVAWPLISDYSCPGLPEPCPRSSNQGWRYFLFTMGGLMLLLWALRFFVFQLYESPKYLMGRGRDEEAVEVIHKVAAYNGKISTLTVEQLKQAEKVRSGRPESEKEVKLDVSAAAAVKRKLAIFDGSHVKPLFATRKLAYSTSILIILWGKNISLYNGFVTYYLETRGTNFGDGSVYITYRNQVILSVIGVPGALLAGYCVELPFLGRRGTLSIFTILTGVFILASTTARTSNALLGWNCGYTFTSNVMYGVLYAISPELFPTKDRGTGNAIVASANRIFGIMAPIIALYANLTTSVPIWVAGAIFLVSGFIALLLPFEPRGKASL